MQIIEKKTLRKRDDRSIFCSICGKEEEKTPYNWTFQVLIKNTEYNHYLDADMCPKCSKDYKKYCDRFFFDNAMFLNIMNEDQVKIWFKDKSGKNLETKKI